MRLLMEKENKKDSSLRILVAGVVLIMILTIATSFRINTLWYIDGIFIIESICNILLLATCAILEKSKWSTKKISTVIIISIKAIIILLLIIAEQIAIEDKDKWMAKGSSV